MVHKGLVLENTLTNAMLGPVDVCLIHHKHLLVTHHFTAESFSQLMDRSVDGEINHEYI